MTQMIFIFVGIDRVLPGDLDGEEAVITMSLSDENDPGTTVSLEQDIVFVEVDG